MFLKFSNSIKKNIFILYNSFILSICLGIVSFLSFFIILPTREDIEVDIKAEDDDGGTITGDLIDTPSFNKTPDKF